MIFRTLTAATTSYVQPDKGEQLREPLITQDVIFRPLPPNYLPRATAATTSCVQPVMGDSRRMI